MLREYERRREGREEGGTPSSSSVSGDTSLSASGSPNNWLREERERRRGRGGEERESSGLDPYKSPACVST